MLWLVVNTTSFYGRLPALPASLPSQSAQSDEDSSEGNNIDHCSETDSTESENGD